MLLIYWFLCVWYLVSQIEAGKEPFDALLTNTPLLTLRYKLNGVEFGLSNVPLEADTQSVGHFTVIRSTVAVDANTYEQQYTFQSTSSLDPVELVQLELTTAEVNFDDRVMMADGFQSWSHSREMGRYNRLPPISKAVAHLTRFDLQGDYNFFPYSGQFGVLHSNSYTYFRSKDDHVVFVGSVSESSGYTYIRADMNRHRLSIYKDVEGKRLSEKELVLKWMVTQRHDGDMEAIWRIYAGYYRQPMKRNTDFLMGWTSWYNYYERVTEQDVLDNLGSFAEYGYPIDVFQIDDGYERAVGDWLDVDETKFPRGMQVLADEIKQAGYIPGLWLAPYAVGFKSRIVRDHPEWLVRNSNDDEFLVAGPNWGGFYALDIYHPGVRAYLQQVFDTVIDTWGYQLLKVDFVFAAAMIPRNGKSRGEILWDAVSLLQDLTRNRSLLLGSGVPLAASWGRLDYCRVSSDASPYWDQTVLRVSHVRERVATANALVSTLHRWPMGSMFGTDPDVFFVRSYSNKLSKDERYTTCMVNAIMGQLTLMSDDIRHYTEEEHRLYSLLFPKVEARVLKMSSVGMDLYRIDYLSAAGRRYVTVVNLSPFPQQIELEAPPEVMLFEHKNVLYGEDELVAWYRPREVVLLKPHETRTFLCVTDRFAGSTGHLVPGWELASWEEQGSTIHLALRDERVTTSQSAVYIGITDEKAEFPTVYVNGDLKLVERYTSREGYQMFRVYIL